MGGTAPTSEVIFAYPMNRPDSSREKIKVTSPAYTSEGNDVHLNLICLAELFHVFNRYPPATLQLACIGRTIPFHETLQDSLPLRSSRESIVREDESEEP